MKCVKNCKLFLGLLVAVYLEVRLLVYFDGTKLFSLLYDKNVVSKKKTSSDLCTNTNTPNHQKVLSYLLEEGDGYSSRTHIDAISKQLKLSDFYRDWKIRIYHNSEALVQKLSIRVEKSGIEFCNIKKLAKAHKDLVDITKVSNKYWNLIPLLDSKVDITCLRSLESDLTEREEAAVKYWLNSNTAIHTMRDNKRHGKGINHGLWCFRNAKYRGTAYVLHKKLLAQSSTFTENKAHTLIDSVFWSRLKHNSIQHDSYKCSEFPGSIPFPNKREDTSTHVGKSRRKDKEPFKVKSCPVQCRPKENKEWNYC